MNSTRIRTGILRLIICLSISSACTLVTPTPLQPTSTTIPVTETFTPLPPSTPTPSPTATSAPLNINPQIIVLAENLPEPDDLVLALDGSIYISDVTAGTVQAYTPEGELK